MGKRPSDLHLNAYDALREKFTRDELISLAWELGIDAEELDPRSKQTAARQLIQRADALGRMGRLAQIVRRDRPEVDLDAPRERDADDSSQGRVYKVDESDDPAVG
jgi:Effector-associated domain 7